MLVLCRAIVILLPMFSRTVGSVLCIRPFKQQMFSHRNQAATFDLACCKQTSESSAGDLSFARDSVVVLRLFLPPSPHPSRKLKRLGHPHAGDPHADLPGRQNF